MSLSSAPAGRCCRVVQRCRTIRRAPGSLTTQQTSLWSQAGTFRKTGLLASPWVERAKAARVIMARAACGARRRWRGLLRAAAAGAGKQARHDMAWHGMDAAGASQPVATGHLRSLPRICGRKSAYLVKNLASGRRVVGRATAHFPKMSWFLKLKWARMLEEDRRAAADRQILRCNANARKSCRNICYMPCFSDFRKSGRFIRLPTCSQDPSNVLL